MSRFFSCMFVAMVLHQSSQMIAAVIRTNNELSAVYRTAQENCQWEQIEFCENPGIEELHALLDGDRLVQEQEHPEETSSAEQIIMNPHWLRGATSFPSPCLATAWSEQRVRPACSSALWQLQDTLDIQHVRHWMRTIVFVIWVFLIWKFWFFVRFLESSFSKREDDATEVNATEKLADDQENVTARLIAPHNKTDVVNKAAAHESAAKKAEELELAAARIAAAQKIAAERVAAAQSKFSERMATAQKVFAERMAAAQPKFPERMAAAQKVFAERMAAAQKIFAERMAAAQQVFAERMAAAQQVFAERMAVAQEIFAKGGSGQDFLSEKTAASQDFLAEKRSASQDFLAEKRSASQDFLAEKRAASQDYITEKTAASQDYIAEKSAASQDYIAEKTSASQDFIAERTAASRDFVAERTAAGQEGHVSNAVLVVLSGLMFIPCLVGAYIPSSLFVS